MLFSSSSIRRVMNDWKHMNYNFLKFDACLMSERFLYLSKSGSSNHLPPTLPAFFRHVIVYGAIIISSVSLKREEGGGSNWTWKRLSKIKSKLSSHNPQVKKVSTKEFEFLTVNFSYSPKLGFEINSDIFLNPHQTVL